MKRGSASALHRRGRLAVLLFATLALLFPLALARPAAAQASAPADSVAIPEPTGFVNDLANVMDETSRAKLEGFLDQVKQKTGAEFAVLTMPTTAPLDPATYKNLVYQRWKMKREGLLLLVAIEERKALFETGYELEGVLPDGVESRIYRTEMLPRFRADDFAGGITAGMVACAARVAREKGVTLEWDGRELRYDESGGRRRGIPWPILLVVVVVVVLMMMNSGGGGRRRRRGWHVGPTFGGWGGGGMGGWGGGFGGGGGGGGSFGGFGGGGGFGSGGGGGGGSW